MIKGTGTNIWEGQAIIGNRHLGDRLWGDQAHESSPVPQAKVITRLRGLSASRSKNVDFNTINPKHYFQDVGSKITLIISNPDDEILIKFYHMST